MPLKQWFLKLLRLDVPEPVLLPHHLSRRAQRHTFTITKALEPCLFRVSMNGKVQVLDMRDWRLFVRDLNIFCMDQHLLWSSLERGEVAVKCEGYQTTLPRGIKYVWVFSIL